MSTYRYELKGTAALGQTWAVEGDVSIEPGGLKTGIDMVMRATFEKLTQGRAVFGHPGVGCKGPYKITEFHLVEQGE